MYFTEPDLVLQTRPSALPAICQELSHNKLLVGHRLEPIPHQRDYHASSLSAKEQKFLLPNTGSFAAVYPLGDSDTCCDQGRYYPSHFDDPSTPEKVAMQGRCASIWPLCGFGWSSKNYSDPKALLEMHYRLLPYPLFRLNHGTGLPLVGANQRVCVPSSGGSGHC